MENRDITFFFQLLFNLKAARSRDVFQIHPAKASAYLIDSVYAICKLLIANGVKDVTLCDRKGAIYEGRQEGMNPVKEEIAKATNSCRLGHCPGNSRADPLVKSLRNNIVRAQLLLLLYGIKL